MAYLLAWNKKKYPAEKFKKDYDDYRKGNPISWSCASKKVSIGDECFLMMVGVGGKAGIVGFGEAVEKSYLAPSGIHSDGRKTPHIDVWFRRLSDIRADNVEVLVSRDKLEEKIPEFHWTQQQSGVPMPDGVTVKLWEILEGMGCHWADRERRTNRLARIIAGYLFDQKAEVTPKQLYGLSKLAWMKGVGDAYIRSTKIPALKNIFGEGYLSDCSDLDAVAQKVSQKMGNKDAEELIKRHTGFTGFYGAFRNSAEQWIERNYAFLLPMYKAAFAAKTDEDRLIIAGQIENLESIPKPKSEKGKGNPANFLTPVFFMLDGDIKFPIINRRGSVQKLLEKLGVGKSGIAEQVRETMKLYDGGNIRDAADIDTISDPREFVSQPIKRETAIGRALPKKYSGDTQMQIKEQDTVQSHVHDQLTDKLCDVLSSYNLREGTRQFCKYDVMVENYNPKGDNLLIEVKSVCDVADVRGAVGQLFYYSFFLKKMGEKFPDKAVLLPKKPSQDIAEFLRWLNIGLLWFDGDKLETDDKWLKMLAR